MSTLIKGETLFSPSHPPPPPPHPHLCNVCGSMTVRPLSATLASLGCACPCTEMNGTDQWLLFRSYHVPNTIPDSSSKVVLLYSHHNSEKQVF